MREQVEERLKFFDTGDTPRRNIDVMTEVKAALDVDKPAAMDVDEAPVSAKKKKKDKKRKTEDALASPGAADSESAKKKKKKKKKSTAE